MRLNSAVAAAVLLSVAHHAVAADAEQCTSQSCKAGTHAQTFADKSDPYYACPSKELSNYIETVIGFTSLATASGSTPNISDTTGEPEFTGATQSVVEGFRLEAKVHSFDEATALCDAGTNKRAVTVLNMPTATTALSAYVMDDSRKKTFWMPISHLDKVK
jgi:hypothetical protein